MASRATAVTGETGDECEMAGCSGSIDTSPESVRSMHGALYRRLRRHMEQHRSALTDDAWRLLTRVAFALYVDSLETAEMTPIPEEVTMRRARRSPGRGG